MKKLMLGAVAAVAVLAIGAGLKPAQAEDFTLKVANYGGVFTASQKKYVGDLFTARTGIKVEYIDANPPDHLAKMIAAKGRTPPYDVALLDDNVQQDGITAGVFEKLDPKIVTNLQYIYDSAKNKQGYGPGFVLFSVGIAYNPEKLKAAGIPEITSWADLWNPKLAGHVAVPDMSISMGRAIVIAAAYMEGGDEGTLDKGIKKVAEIKAQSYPKASSQIEAQLQSGDIWVVPWVNGRAWGMIDKGAPLKYIMPKEGGFGQMSTIDLVKGSAHPKEAQIYINMTLDPLAQLGQANEIPYGPTNKLLVPVLAAYPDLSKKFPSSPEDIAKLRVVDWTKFNANYEKAIDMWNRQIAGK